MLTKLRSKTGGIVAKVFIGLLAMSFAIWGVSDIARVKPKETLITAGETTVSVKTFSNRFRTMLQQIARQTGRSISPDEARQMGLDRQLLVQLVREAVQREAVRRLNLSLPADALVQRIRQMPQFAGPGGVFDRQVFQQALYNAGLSEQEFLDELRDGILGQGMMEAVTADMVAPKILVEQAHAFRNAMRDAEYVVIVADETALPQPDEATLKKFYEENRQRFSAPERRVLRVLALTPKALAKQVTVDENELKQLYETQKNRFFRPEKRSVEQLRLDGVEAAKKALEALQSGAKTWEQVLAEHKLKPEDVRIGPYEKKRFPGEELANAAFAAKEGEVTGPVKTPLGVFLVKVVKVVPAHEVSFAEARKELETYQRLEKARDLIADYYDRIEEARASGQGLAEAAAALGLKLMVTPPVALDGTGADGKPVSVPGGEAVLREAFRSEPGMDNDVVELGNDGYVWFEVEKIVPAGPVPFEKAKDRVLAAWKAQALAAALKRKADALKRKAESGTPLEKIAEELAASVKSIEKLKRNDARPDFPSVAVRALFAAKPGAFVVTISPDGRKAWLMRVKTRPLPKPQTKSDEMKALRVVLAQGLVADTGAEFLAALQQVQDVKIDMKLWRQATGAGQ